MFAVSPKMEPRVASEPFTCAVDTLRMTVLEVVVGGAVELLEQLLVCAAVSASWI